MVCFVNVTPTTEIYPDCHTLALLDALPILPPRRKGLLLLQLVDAGAAGVPAAVPAHARSHGRAGPAPRPQAARTRRRPAPRLLRHRRRQRQGIRHAPDRGARPIPDPRRHRHDGIRSEEHTSELQLLTRISYAVFFLKKNTNKIKSRLSLNTYTTRSNSNQITQ